MTPPLDPAKEITLGAIRKRVVYFLNQLMMPPFALLASASILRSASLILPRTVCLALSFDSSRCWTPAWIRCLPSECQWCLRRMWRVVE